MPNLSQCHLCNRVLNSKTFLDNQSHLFICKVCNISSSHNDEIDNKMLDAIFLINETFIDKIKDIHISGDMLQNIYMFLRDFTRFHIKSIESLPSFRITDKIYHVN